METILRDKAMREEWIAEVASMRNRIHNVRHQFVSALSDAGVSRDFSFLINQKGMFSFTGLNKEQAHKLRSDYSIYIVDSGRINVAGLTSENLSRVAKAFKELLG